MLRKTFPALALLALLFRPPAAGQEAAWGRYTFPGDEFSVELPGEPYAFVETRNVDWSGRDYDAMRVFSLYSRGVIYTVVSYDKLRRSESLDDFASYFAGQNFKRRVTKSAATLGGLAGQEYRSAAPLGAVGRVFRTASRAYLVWAYYRPEAGSAGAERFVESLRLSAAPEGAAIGERAPAPSVGVAPEGDGPFKVADVTRKGTIVFNPQPGYTEEARMNGVTGVVRLRAVMSSSGRVGDITVEKGLPDGLTARSMNAARHIVFFPAQKDGRDVSQYIVLEYNFNIH